MVADDSIALTKRLWRTWVRHHGVKIFLILVVIAISAATTGAYPLLINEAYDAFGNKNAAAIALLPLAVLVVVFAKAASLYLQTAMTNRLGMRIETDMQVALYDHLVDADVAQLAAETPAALTQRFTNDLSYVRDALTRATGNFVRDVLTLISVFAAMIYLDWVLSIFAILILPAAVIPIERIGRRIRKMSTSTQEEMGTLAELVSESFSAARVVKSYSLEGYLKARAVGAFERVRKLKVKAADQRGRVEPTLEFLGGFAVAGVLVVIGWRITSGGSTIGEFTGFVSALLIAAQPLRALGGLNAAIQQGLSAVARIFAVLDRPAKVVDRPGAKPLVVGGAAIRLTDVVFAYPDGTRAIDGMSLDIPGGQVTAIVGRSGAGKSTLFGLLNRLYDVTDGSIAIDGVDIRDVTTASLRRAIALVPQEAVLFNDTVEANIRFGRPEASEEEVRAAARSAAADGFIEALPEGYATMVGEGGMRLSGGQRQRITIARAFLKDAPILLLDEATSALDSESEHLVREALNRLTRGRTTLVIAHRLSTIRQADLIAVMDQGRVAEVGRHDALIAKGGIFARLHSLQFDGTIADDIAARSAANPS